MELSGTLIGHWVDLLSTDHPSEIKKIKKKKSILGLGLELK
jgi:hypothetical protein